MKNFPVSVLNSIGFQSAEQKAYFAAHVLHAATLGGDKIVFQKAVAGPRANPAVPSVPEISSPAVKPLPGWHNAIQISRTSTNIQIIAFLPNETTPELIGYPTNEVQAVKQITDPNLQVGMWKGDIASNQPENYSTEEPTLERYFVKWAKQCANRQVKSTTYQIGQQVVSVEKYTLNIPVTNYDPANYSLQLNKINNNQPE